MNVNERADAKAPERPPGRKARQSEATRGALLAAAGDLFAERGYAAVATEEIVHRAGVTRGALYHHFADKRELFAAVYEGVEADLVAELADSAGAASDPLDALCRGALAFLDACRRPEVERIALIDAPSVLGWERWREIGFAHGMGLMQAALEAAIEAGQIPRQPVRPLAHLLLGALDEAAMLLARSDDEQLEREVRESVTRYLQSLGAGAP